MSDGHAPITRQSFYVGLLVVLLLAIVASTVLIIKTVRSSPAVLTCEVQNRGLHAQQHLVHIVHDIEVLVTPYPGEPKGAPVPPEFQRVIGNLREEAGAFVTLQNEQPASRTC